MKKNPHTLFFSILCIKDKSLGWYIKYIYVNLTVPAWLLSFSFRFNCALIKGLRPRFLLKKRYGKKLDSGRMVWALGLWTPGFLDSARLDTWIRDNWTIKDWTLGLWTTGCLNLERLNSGRLDAWTLDAWILGLWTTRQLDNILIFNIFRFVTKEVLYLIGEKTVWKKWLIFLQVTKFFPNEIFPRSFFSRPVFFPDFFSPDKEFIPIFFSIIIIIIIISISIIVIVIIIIITYLFAKSIITMFFWCTLIIVVDQSSFNKNFEMRVNKRNWKK